MFDALEDTDVDECVEKALKIAKIDSSKASSGDFNNALIFIKPGAYNEKVKELLAKTIQEKSDIFKVT